MKIAKLDCTQYSKVCQEYEVRGYPTLLFFKNGKKIEKYGGGRDLSSLLNYAEKMSKQADNSAQATDEKVPDKKEQEKKKEAAAAEDASDVLVFETTNFDEGIAKGTTFVKFYAPWCGHCKRLAPTWAELATKFKGNVNVNIAKIDCTSNKEKCSEYKVNGYPTLLLFRDGKKVAEHNGGRDLNSLNTFVMDNLPHDEL